MRHQISLSDTWQFQLDPQGRLTHATLAPDQTIAVPLPWQAAFPELQQYSGYAWYRRSIDLGSAWLGGEILLLFGAVDYWCQIFVNGQLVGEHEGGYTPISLPIRRYMRAGRNEIVVRVYDAAQAQIIHQRWPERAGQPATTTPPFDPIDIPHGKQEWYINVGGIWQDVTLTAVPTSYIDSIHVTPNIHSGEAHIAVALAGDLATVSTGRLQLAINDQEGHAWAADVSLVAGQQRYLATIAVDRPQLWDIDSPTLYTATATLSTDHGDDQLSARFGFREITTRDGQLLLNGAPLFLLSALDQDLYPETIYTVPSEAYLRDQFQKAKALGLNNLRCHIKPPDPRYLDLADELGLLVWAEIPSWRTFYERSTLHPAQRDLDDTIKRRVEQTLDAMIQRDYNHPALIIWTIVNEDWGTSLPLSAADRAWVEAMYERCKQRDPTRLVVDNSACLHSWGPNIHVRSDIDDFHIYANIPDQAEGFEYAIEQFDLRPLWTYSNHGDARRTGQEPLILSEFGNWGLPSLEQLSASSGDEPPWFNIGPWWSGWDGEPGWPSGVAERFARFGLDAIWKDYEAFAAATQWHQFAAMKFEIETMRRQPNLAGYVITEFTDAYWESNGLLDFYRNPKVYHNLFATINAPDMIIPQVERYACWDDELITARMHVAHYSAANWSGAHLRWRFGEAGGEHEVSNLPRGAVAEVGRERWHASAVDRARTIQIQLELGGANTLARNHVDVLVLPSSERQARYQGQIAVVVRNAEGMDEASDTWALAPEGGERPEHATPTLEAAGARDLAWSIPRLGYHTTQRLTADTTVVVTSHPTAKTLRWVRDGGDMLFINRGASPFFWAQGRSGAYSGNWMTSFSWLRPGVHRRLAVDNPLGLPFRRVMPTRTILGIPVEDPAVQPDLLAGMIAGWVNHPSVHTVQFRYGRGRVIMTTFAFEEALPTDPVAVALFHDLIEHLVSDACQPTLAANY